MNPELNPYETEKILSEYLTSFYFGPENPLFNPSFNLDILYPSDYLSTLAKVATNAFKNQSKIAPKEPLKAFDIGCGVGRLAFELSRDFDQILAIDYSHLFVKTCQELKTKGFIEYKRRKQGEIFEKTIAKVPENTGIIRERVEFAQGDAENLGEVGDFDLIVASNLIDRLGNPEKFLQSIDKLLKKHGVLVLASPYTWLEEYTKREKWFGGIEGKESFENLNVFMKNIGFELLEQMTLKLLIPEHERKFQLCLPHVTVWKRKEN